MATISVGLSKKVPGDEPYSSTGVSVGLEIDLDIADREDFAERVDGLYDELRAALDREVAKRSRSTVPASRRDFWGGNGGNGGNGHGRRSSGRGSADAFGSGNGGRGVGNGQDNGSEPATKAQVRYVVSLLARSGARTKPEMTARLSEVLGTEVEDVYGLDRKAASRAIETLKTDGNGKG